MGIRVKGDLDRFGRSNNCDDLKKEIGELENSIAERSGELRRFKSVGLKIDSGHTGRLAKEREKLDEVKRKFKNLGCDDPDDDPQPVPVPLPAPTPSTESQRRRNAQGIGVGGKVALGAGAAAAIFIVGKKLIGAGLLLDPITAPVGLVLVFTP